MVSGSLALLYFLLSFHGGRQGSGPDRGPSPVEWGDFPSICTSVRPYILSLRAQEPARLALDPASQAVCLSLYLFVFCSFCPSAPPLWAIQPGLKPSQPGLRPSQPDLRPSQPGWPRMGNGRMDGRTYLGKISPFYKTLSPIGAAALLPKGISSPIKSRARELLII